MKNEYDINFSKFQNNEITETEWREFCDKEMDKVLADTKDVFERLKVRWKKIEKSVDESKKTRYLLSMKNEVTILKTEKLLGLFVVTYRLEGENFNRVSNRRTMEEVNKAIQELIDYKNGVRVVNNIVPSVKYSNSGRYFVNNRGVSVEE